MALELRITDEMKTNYRLFFEDKIQKELIFIQGDDLKRSCAVHKY